MSNTKTITEFYNTDAINYASYDNLRKLCSCVDGLKISQRKILYTAKKRNQKEFIKTETFANIASIETNYIHGSSNFCSIINNMVQNFVGATPYPLLKGNDGGFGSRINTDCAAPRYTRIAISDIANELFLGDDDDVLINQIFEGDKIEPQYYVPIFPVLFLNGSDGVSTGFAETIYPREPKLIIDYIKKRLSKSDDEFANYKAMIDSTHTLKPYFRNHKGEVVWNEESKVYQSRGVVKRIKENVYEITELPINRTYTSYCEFLDKLVEKDTIVDYDDLCDTKTNQIRFLVKLHRGNKTVDENNAYDVLKLVSNLSETLCFINEKNQVEEFNSISDILDRYISIRLDYYVKRKEHILSELNEKITYLISCYKFCYLIVTKKIDIFHKTKEERDKILDEVSAGKYQIKKNPDYEYLYRMPISHLTQEELNKLVNQINDVKTKINVLTNKKESDIWIDELKKLSKLL